MKHESNKRKLEEDDDGETIVKRKHGDTEERKFSHVGNWACPSCNFLNFATRRKCKECCAANPDPELKKARDEVSLLAAEVARTDKVMTRVITKQGVPQLQVRKRKGDDWMDHTEDTAVVSEDNKPVAVGDGGWTCCCGHENYAIRRNCQECKQRNPAADDSGDWVCSKDNCWSRNFASRTFCRTCKTSKDEAMSVKVEVDEKPAVKSTPLAPSATQDTASASEDTPIAIHATPSQPPESAIANWTCSQCNSSNYAFRLQCKMCNAGNPKADTFSDWKCMNDKCGAANTYARISCYKCKTRKQGCQVYSGQDDKWTCSNEVCGVSNFKSRRSCYKCKTKNEERTRHEQTNRRDNKMWRCPGETCSYMNHDICYKCKKCSTLRPDYKSRMLGHVGLRHISYQATEEDVKKFFYPLKVSSVRIFMSKTGEPMGKADVVFHSHEAAVQAMDKEPKLLGREFRMYLDSKPLDGAVPYNTTSTSENNNTVEVKEETEETDDSMQEAEVKEEVEEEVEVKEENDEEMTVTKEEEVTQKKRKERKRHKKKNKDANESGGGIQVLSNLRAADDDDGFKWSQSILTLLQMNSSMSLCALQSKAVSTYKLLSLSNTSLVLSDVEVNKKVKSTVNSNDMFILHNDNVRLKT